MMNGIKNTALLILSVIVLLQSAFLVYFMHCSTSSPKSMERAQAEPAKKARVKQPLFKLEFPQLVHPKVPLETVPKQQPAASADVSVPFAEKPKMSMAPKALPAKTLGRIALVIDDWGYNLKNKGFITDNDFHVTLSILPSKPYSAVVAHFAFEKNKDVILHMPMEPHDKNQYGLEENTLLVGMEKSKVYSFLRESFQTVPHAKGLSNHMGSMATEDSRLMGMVMAYLKKNDMLFFDSLVSRASVGRAVARQYGVLSASRDVFIDNEEDPGYIRQQVLKLAERAKQTGLAYGIGHDRPRTIAVLQEMIPRLKEEGYRFVNLSEAVGS